MPEQAAYSGIAQMNLASRFAGFESATMELLDKMSHRIQKLELQSHQTEAPAMTNGIAKENGLNGATTREKKQSPLVPYPDSDSDEEPSKPSKPKAASEEEESKSSEEYMPLYIAALKPYSPKSQESTPLTLEKSPALTGRAIMSVLGGSEYSPGFITEAAGLAALSSKRMAVPSRSKKNEDKSASESFYLLDKGISPYLPSQPGAHGAHLTVFVRESVDQPDGLYAKTPLFVCLDGSKSSPKKYTYMGHYSQTRWSDRLDHERAASLVPEHVKRHWAHFLTNPSRPAWLTEQMRSWVEAKPSFEGAAPKEDDVFTEDTVKARLDEYFGDLRDWEDYTTEQVQDLTEEKAMGAFEASDNDALPGLRFVWEYLECVSYDRNFVYALSSACEKVADAPSEDVRPVKVEAAAPKGW